jgi:hypothetical protein
LPRMTTRRLMSVILVIGLGGAALQSSTVLWSSAVFTFTVAILSATVLAAFAHQGLARMTWAGFALLGWLYLGTAFGPWAGVNGVSAPPYLTKWLVDYAGYAQHSKPTPDRGPRGELLFLPPVGIPVFGGKPIWEAPPPSGPFPNALQFRRILHGFASILFGLVGAVLGPFIATRSVELAATSPGIEAPQGRSATSGL